MGPLIAKSIWQDTFLTTHILFWLPEYEKETMIHCLVSQLTIFVH